MNQDFLDIGKFKTNLCVLKFNYLSVNHGLYNIQLIENLTEIPFSALSDKSLGMQIDLTEYVDVHAV